MSKWRKKTTMTGSDKHHYLKAHKWADGTLAFWRTEGHKQEAYEDFYKRQCEEAARLNKI